MTVQTIKDKVKSLPLASSLIRHYRVVEKRRRMKKYYSQFIRRDDLCFDIGANFGIWSEVFLSLGAKVIAVEPQSYCYHLLMEKFMNNSAITILKKGVGSKEELLALNVADNNISSSFSQDFIEKYKHYSVSWPITEKVETTTLDKLISQFGLPHFCKIDVEGFELEVFKGLSHPISFIQFEYVPPFKAQVMECIDKLSKLGKPKFNYSSYENMKLQLSGWVNESEVKKLIENFQEDFLVCDILVAF